MKINFSKIEIPTLEGKPIKGVHKLVANLIYNHTKELDMVEKAFDINKKKEVELSDKEVEEIKRLLEDERVLSFVKKYTLKVINEAKK